MATLTVSTNGEDRVNGECHDVRSIEHSRFFGNPETERDVATLSFDLPQAMGIAIDLLYQLVDGGVISGWNVQFPEGDGIAPLDRA